MSWAQAFHDVGMALVVAIAFFILMWAIVNTD